MKKFTFATILVIVSLVLGSFMFAPIAKQSTALKQSTETVSVPDFSPFFFAASAPIVSMGVSGPVGPDSMAPAGYSCQLLAQSPADWSNVKSRQIFDTTWVLKNSGSKAWGKHGIDVKYRGDTRMHYNIPDWFDLPKNVGIGGRLQLTIDMIAPKAAGYYVSNWGLYVGSQVFCKFYVIVVVNK
jgi:hypothetical protein